MDIEIKGLKELEKKLGKIADEQAITFALKQSCALVERTAKQEAPHNTGALRWSITSEVEGNTGVIYTPLEYAPYLEYGTGLFAEEGGRTDVPWKYKDDKGEWHSTKGIKPHPFMRPALDQNRAEILRIFKEGLMRNG